MQVSDFQYHLPADLIAQRPLPVRSASRLLCLDGRSGEVMDRRFVELPDLLRPGDLLVLNDTRVLAARLLGNKQSGGRVEVLVERILSADHALALVRASKPPPLGSRMVLEGAVEVEVVGRQGELFELSVHDGRGMAGVLEQFGRVPLPPYIERQAAAEDRERYQTVFARVPGAVAAPTAGLHFDPPLLERVRAAGVDIGYVTLHVGAGTFLPVRAERVEDHRLYAERFAVGSEVCAQVERARSRRGRVIAVGTTVVRTLEAASAAGELRPMEGEVELFIYPGYRFRTVDALLTNFHLPGSTLLMLVCACAGRAAVMSAYRHAVEQRYRFYSYGDAMFVSAMAPC